MYRRRNVVSVPDMPDDKFVRDAAYPDALSCIAECFGTGYEQYVMVSVMGYGWLVGRMERFA